MMFYACHQHLLSRWAHKALKQSGGGGKVGRRILTTTSLHIKRAAVSWPAGGRMRSACHCGELGSPLFGGKHAALSPAMCVIYTSPTLFAAFFIFWHLLINLSINNHADHIPISFYNWRKLSSKQLVLLLGTQLSGQFILPATPYCLSHEVHFLPDPYGTWILVQSDFGSGETLGVSQWSVSIQTRSIPPTLPPPKKQLGISYSSQVPF